MINKLPIHETTKKNLTDKILSKERQTQKSIQYTVPPALLGNLMNHKVLGRVHRGIIPLKWGIISYKALLQSCLTNLKSKTKEDQTISE